MTADVELRTTQVDLGGLMKVLGQNLYSTPEVAVRELVQNAHDSCMRRRLAGDADFEARITVTTHGHTLTITDTGAGLTREEIIRDLATVGSGATGRARESNSTDDLIGAFGLGFLSAYFISDSVEVHTTSHTDPTVGWRFSSRGGERYQLASAPVRAVGSAVTLTLSADFHHLAGTSTLTHLVQKHCGLLPLPIFVGANTSDPVNAPPPWRETDMHPVRWRREALALAERFEQHFKPLCVIPIHPDEHSDAAGMVWIQDGGTYGTTDNRTVSVFVRGMLVDDDARDLLPTWAGFCGAVIESNSLTPTASRESLQTDAVFHAVRRQVREALITGMGRVARAEAAAWRRVLRRHNEALLGASLTDPRMFSLLAEDLKVPTSQGSLPLKIVRARAKGRIPVSVGADGEHEAVLFKAQQIPVVDGTRYAVLPFCRRDAEIHGATLIQVGTREGEKAIFQPAKPTAEDLATLTRLLGHPKRSLHPVRFAPTTLPLVLTPDHEAALKARIEADEADKQISSALLSLARRFTAKIEGGVDARLFINLDAPLIQALLTGDAVTQATLAPVLNALAELFASGGAHDVDAGAAFEALSSGLLKLVG